MPREIYKTLKDLKSKYPEMIYNQKYDCYIDKYGNVASVYIANRTGTACGYIKHAIVEHNSTDHYLAVKMHKRTIDIHRLLAETFIPNPDNLPIVDHIDRNRHNNDISNLRWASYKVNARNSAKHYEAEFPSSNRLEWQNRYHKSHRITISGKQYYLPTEQIKYLRSLPKTERLSALNKIRQA